MDTTITIQFPDTCTTSSDSLSWICCNDPTKCTGTVTCPGGTADLNNKVACHGVRSATFQIASSVSMSASLTIQASDKAIQGGGSGVVNAVSCPSPDTTKTCSPPTNKHNCQWKVSLTDCCYMPASSSFKLKARTVEGCDGKAVPDPYTSQNDIDKLFQVPSSALRCGSLTSLDTQTGEDPCPGITVARTFTYTDAYGSATGTQTLTVKDTKPPTSTCADGSTATGDCKFRDSCDPNPSKSSTCSVTPSGLTRTWTAQDKCGNKMQAINQHVETPCKTLAPQDYPGECDTSVIPTATTTVSDVFASGPEYCPDLSISSDDTPSGGICDDTGIIVDRIYHLQLGLDLSSRVPVKDQTCTQKFTIPKDTTPPYSEDCTDGSIASPAGCTFQDKCGLKSASSKCSVVNTKLTRIWEAYDNCDNLFTLQQPVTTLCLLKGEDQPGCTDANVPDALPSTSTNIETVFGVPASVCTDLTMAKTDVTRDRTALPCASTGGINVDRTYSLTDVNNLNAADCVQTITITDQEAPKPADSCAALAGSSEICCGRTMPEVNTGTCEFTDNCGGKPSVALSCSQDSTGALTRTWTATDECNNPSTVQQSFTFAVGSCPASP